MSEPDLPRYLRFVWQMDAEGRFTLDSEEFRQALGPRTAAVLGRPWREITAALGLDPEGLVARAIAAGETFSGVKLSWPAADAPPLEVELSGLPLFDRARRPCGYRGFGVCREVERIAQLLRARRRVARASTPSLGQEPPGSPQERPALAVAPPSRNVVPFRAADRTPTLSPGERKAFHEIARQLSARLSGAGSEPAPSCEAPQASEPTAAEWTVRPPDESPANAGAPTPGDLDERLKAAELALRRAEAELRELRCILDTATDGVIVLDRAGRVLSANRSAEALFGREAHELAGCAFAELFAPESARVALDNLDRLARTEGVLNGGREVIGRLRQGGLIPLFMSMGRIGDGEKLCAVLRDITQWKKTEEELINAKQQAERASLAKSDFLAKISHEIRTPLNSIIGFSEMMMEERFGPIDNARYRQYLRDIHASGAHVVALLNDLLDLSKIEAGKLELTFANVDLNALVQQCVALMQPQANRERIVIRTSLAPGLPQVEADARSVRQIVLNLLSNAIKFGGANSQVIVSTAHDESGEVILRVRDVGVGMSEQDIAIALEPFRQLATSARLRSGGSGLGLPLTKALAEANRARFSIASAAGTGTLVEIAFAPCPRPVNSKE